MSTEPATTTRLTPPLAAPISPATITLKDLTGHLIWPHLLRAPRLAFSPHRILLSTCAIALVGFLDALWRLAAGSAGGSASGLGPVGRLLSRESEALAGLVRAVVRLDAQGAGAGLCDMALGVPLGLVRDGSGGFSWGLLAGVVIVVPLALAILAVFGAAVTRSVAIEFAHGARAKWTGLLSFATARWAALLGAVLGPVALGSVLAVVLAGVAWVVFGVAVVDVVGAILLPVFVLGATIVGLLLGGYLCGGAMLVPAVVCDDSDAFDAVQRAYAMFFARPMWAGIYAIITLCISLVGFVFVAGICAFVLEVLGTLTGLRLSLDGGEAQAGAAGQTTAGTIVGFWVTVVRVLVAGYGLSVLFSGATLFFLVMRQRVDGQDVTEVKLAPGEGA